MKYKTLWGLLLVSSAKQTLQVQCNSLIEIDIFTLPSQWGVTLLRRCVVIRSETSEKMLEDDC